MLTYSGVCVARKQAGRWQQRRQQHDNRENGLKRKAPGEHRFSSSSIIFQEKREAVSPLRGIKTSSPEHHEM